MAIDWLLAARIERRGGGGDSMGINSPKEQRSRRSIDGQRMDGDEGGYLKAN